MKQMTGEGPIAHDRRRKGRFVPVVLLMTVPNDRTIRNCLFCNQVFKAGESWFKIGFPGCYIGVHDSCSARKDAEFRHIQAARR